MALLAKYHENSQEVSTEVQEYLTVLTRSEPSLFDVCAVCGKESLA